MDDIDIIPGDDFTEIMVALDVLVPLPFGLIHLPGESLGIDIAHREDFTRHAEVGTTNATTTKNGARQFVRGSGLTIQTQHSTGNDGNTRKRGKAA